MNDFAEPGTLAPTGLYLGGTKYMVIQGEPGAVIRGKKVLTLALILLWNTFNYLSARHISEMMFHAFNKENILCTMIKP